MDKSQAAVETRAILERVARFAGVSLDIKKSRKSVNLCEYDSGRAIFKALSYLNLNEPCKAAMVLGGLSAHFLEIVGRTDPGTLAGDGAGERLLAASGLAVDVARNAEKWRRFVHAEAIEELGPTGLFTEGELRDKIEVFAGVQVDDLFDKDYVRVYRLKEGSAPVPRETKFRIMKEVQVSRDLDGYIRAAHYLSARAPGEVVLVPFFKVEERLDLSFWSFFVVYEDHVWVATDQKEFHNPRNKESTRRTDRVRDEKLENMWLPDVFAMLGKRRSKSREVAAFGGVTRLLSIGLKAFHPCERFFLVRLAERIVGKCLREDLVRATTIGLHSDRLLLEHRGAVPDRTEKLEGWTKDARTRHGDMMATVPASTTKALVPMDYSVVVRSGSFDRNWLGPVDQLDALAHWIVVDERRSEIQRHFDSLEKREKEDSAALQGALDERAESVLDLAFSARAVGWVATAVDQFGGDGLKSGSRTIVRFVQPFEKDGYDYGWSMSSLLTVGLDGRRSDLFSRDKGYRTKCRSCDFSVRRPAVTIHVRHWSQLQYLLGGGRDLVPPYFKCFVAHNFEPYTGNSILDNTHPLALINDPCTGKRPNGINVQVFTCGACANRRLKGKPDRLVVNDGVLVDPKTVGGLSKSKYYGWSPPRANGGDGKGGKKR